MFKEDSYIFFNESPIFSLLGSLISQNTYFLLKLHWYEVG